MPLSRDIVAADMVLPDNGGTLQELITDAPAAGAEIFVKSGYYDEDTITVDPFKNILIRSKGAVFRPTADSKTILTLDGSTSWPTIWDKRFAEVKGLRFETNGKDGCVAVKILNAIGSRVDFQAVGEVGHEFADVLLLDSTSGKWTERIRATIEFDYANHGFRAKATSGNNSLDHLQLDIAGNLRANGDKGVFIESSVQHANMAWVWGQIWAAAAGATGPDVPVICWDIDADLARGVWFMGCEGGAAAAVLRVAVDLTGSTINKTMIFFSDAGQGASNWTDVIKGNVEAFNIREIGAPLHMGFRSALADLFDVNNMNAVLNSSLTEAGHKDHSAAGHPVYWYAGENMYYGDGQLAVCYMKSDGKLWKAKGDSINTLPAIVVCLTSVNANGKAQFAVPGAIIRDDSLDETPGADVYVSNATAGRPTTTKPTTSGHYVQKIGTIWTANSYLFQPLDPVVIP